AGHHSAGGRRGERRAGAALRAIEEIAQQLDVPYLWGGVGLAQGMVAYMTGHWRRAVELCDRAGVIFRTRCTVVSFEVDTVTLVSLWSLQFGGELAELGRRW